MCSVQDLTPSIDRSVIALSDHSYGNPPDHHYTGSSYEATLSHASSGLEQHDLDPPNTPEYSSGIEESSRTQHAQYLNGSTEVQIVAGLTQLLSLGNGAASHQPTVQEQSLTPAVRHSAEQQTVTTNSQMVDEQVAGDRDPAINPSPLAYNLHEEAHSLSGSVM